MSGCEARLAVLHGSSPSGAEKAGYEMPLLPLAIYSVDVSSPVTPSAATLSAATLSAARSAMGFVSSSSRPFSLPAPAHPAC